MILTNLSELTIQMKEHQILRQRFEFTYKGITIRTYYFIDTEPYTLIFGVVSYRYGFIIKVETGFKIVPYIDNIQLFWKIFDIKYDPQHTYKPIDFFQYFNSQLPTRITEHIPEPKEYVPYIPNKVEEETKIYFANWRRNDGVSTHVSPANLEKTRLLLGQRLYEICKNQNISSCWTADPHSAEMVRLP